MNEENLTPEFEEPEDNLSTGLTIISFCIPIVGAYVYFTNKRTLPNKANSACYAALWGVGVGIAINVIARVLGAG